MPENEVKKTKRHRLTNMRYDEISFVDRGANQHANVMIVKREGVSKTSVDATGVHPGQKSSGGSKPPPRKAGWYAADRAPTESGSGKGKKSQRAQNWKTDKHPRKASGSPAGGEFDQTSDESKKKYGKGGTTAAKQKAASKTTGDKVVTVKKGDTLWDLAVKYYGDGTKWKVIAKANGVKDPKKLPIGKKLTIPGTGTKKKAATKTTASSSSSASPGEKLTMEAGGKVHWEKIKAQKKSGSTTTNKSVKQLEAELRAAKTRDAKLKARRALKAAQARKKLAIKKSTGVEKIAAQIMFNDYTGRR